MPTFCGDAWRDQGEYEKALADFEAALKLDPKYTYALNARGITRFRQKDYEGAIAAFTEVMKVDPKYKWALANRADMHRKKDEFDKAMADDDEALRIDPKYVYAVSGRGACWLKLGDFDKAKAAFEEAAKMDEKSPVGFGELAWFLATCPEAKYRDAKKAVELATKACEMTKWKHASYLMIVAAAHAEAGTFDKAVEWQTTAVDLALPHMKAEYTERLDLFKAKKPYRETIKGNSF